MIAALTLGLGAPHTVRPHSQIYWYFFQNIGGSKTWIILCKILGRFAIYILTATF